MINISLIRERLINSIKTSGYSQTELSQRLGIRQPSLHQYLTGRAMPSIETLANLCLILNVSADYLLGLEDEQGNRVSIDD